MSSGHPPEACPEPPTAGGLPVCPAPPPVGGLPPAPMPTALAAPAAPAAPEGGATLLPPPLPPAGTLGAPPLATATFDAPPLAAGVLIGPPVLAAPAAVTVYPVAPRAGKMSSSSSAGAPQPNQVRTPRPSNLVEKRCMLSLLPLAVETALVRNAPQAREMDHLPEDGSHEPITLLWRPTRIERDGRIAAEVTYCEPKYSNPQAQTKCPHTSR